MVESLAQPFHRCLPGRVREQAHCPQRRWLVRAGPRYFGRAHRRQTQRRAQECNPRPRYSGFPTSGFSPECSDNTTAWGLARPNGGNPVPAHGTWELPCQPCLHKTPVEQMTLKQLRQTEHWAEVIFWDAIMLSNCCTENTWQTYKYIWYSKCRQNKSVRSKCSNKKRNQPYQLEQQLKGQKNSLSNPQIIISIIVTKTRVKLKPEYSFYSMMH